MSLTKDETLKCFKIMASLLDKGMFFWNELKGLSDVMEKLNENVKEDKYELESSHVIFILNSFKVCSNRKPIDIEEQMALDFSGMFNRLKEVKVALDAKPSAPSTITEI